MTMKTILFTLLLFITVSYGNVSQKRFNVERTPATSVQTIAEDTISVQVPAQVQKSFFLKSSAWQELVSLQKDLRDRLTAYLKAMKEGDDKVISWFLLICFIYGLVHALGPGHGKSVVAGYFLARRGKWWHGVSLGFSITMIHTMSAVILLFVLFLLARTMVFSTFELSRMAIEKASYLLVVFTGLILIGASIFNRIKIKKEKSSNSIIETQASWKELLAISFITGIVPCPAVALVVFFCLLQGLYGMALLGALAIGFGMAFTNILFGVGTIFLRRGIDHGAHKIGFLTQNVNMIVSLCGGILVSITGLLLFFSVSGP